MPPCDGTRTAKTIFASTACSHATIWAILYTSICEILSMLSPMTFFAQRKTVIHIETASGAIGPSFNMVSMQNAGSTTSAASIRISPIDRFSPNLQLGAQSGAITFQRSPILIGVAARPTPGTRARTEFLLQRLMNGERRPTCDADSGFRRIPLRPADFATPSRGCAVREYIKILLASFADAVNFGKFWSVASTHIGIILLQSP